MGAMEVTLTEPGSISKVQESLLMRVRVTNQEEELQESVRPLATTPQLSTNCTSASQALLSRLSMLSKLRSKSLQQAPWKLGSRSSRTS